MEFISENNINEKLVNSFDKELPFELAIKYQDDNHMPRIDGLKDWLLLKGIKINRQELSSYLSTSP